MKKLLISLTLALFILFSVFADDSAPDQDNSGKDRPTVALVLSGGGAKGIAHIPIIEALETYGIPIDKVFGTSMGALIGGMYAAGLSPGEMREIVTGTDLTKLFTVFDSNGYNEVLDAFDYHSNNVLSVSLGQGIGGVNGFIDDYLVLNFFNTYIGNVPDDIDFDTDLVIPFECNATDMLTGDEIVFRDGSLVTAMRSSMSLPLIFEPVMLDDGSVYMDGGIVSNYIVHRAYEEGYDIIIVVTLNGYGKEKRTKENYSSLSGTMGSTLSVVLGNVSKGELDHADYWFSPDLQGYGTLSFGASEGILERGEIEVKEQKDKFEMIASLFTEEQKEYKDPNRVGEYYSKYPERSLKEHLASHEQRHEDLLGRTRVSLGLYGSGGYGFFFDQPEYEDPEPTRRALFPTLSIRAFIKDLGGSRFSFDFRFKLSLNKTTDLDIINLFRLTPDKGSRLYALSQISAKIGSLSFVTDKNEPYRRNIIEGLAGFNLGFLLTNERNYSVKCYATADNTWDESNRGISSDSTDMYAFVPSASIEAVFYPNYSNGFFASKGMRLDLIAKGGYNTRLSEWFYKLGFAGEFNFSISEKVSAWIDATAYSGYGSMYLRSTFEEYGGWDGVPGYAIGSLYAEFICGGIGLQINLKPGFVSNYLAFVIRAGIKSDAYYGWSGFQNTGFYSNLPFADLRLYNWDIGASVGYGMNTPVGDIIFGVGFNLNMQLGIYVEIT